MFVVGNVVVFVDESGIIPKHKSKKTNYFIITLLFLREEDQGLVKNAFKKYRLQIAKRKQELYDELVNNKEIKGSSMSENDKNVIYDKLIQKCGDKFEIGVIILNNHKATSKFRSNSSRAFNYLIKMYMQKHFKVNGNIRLLLGQTVSGDAFRFPVMHKKQECEYTDKATE